MTIIAKRERVRALRADGIIPQSYISGVGIAKLTNERADEIIAQFNRPGVELGPELDAALEKPAPKPEAQPAPPIPAPHNGNGDLASILAASLAPHLESKVDAQQLEDLREKFVAIVDHNAERVAEKLDRAIEKAKASLAQPVRVEIKTQEEEPRDCGVQHYQFPLLLRLCAARVHAFLPGPAGSGKTSAGEQVAKSLQLACSSISVTQQTSKVDLLGYQGATGSLVRTQFRERYEHGGIFILDEIDAGNPNVLSVLNSALSNGRCAFPDGMIERHPDFILIATGNTVGQGGDRQYVGRNALDAATIDRFAFLDWQYDEGLEEHLATGSALPGAPRPWQPSGETCQPAEWSAQVRRYRKAANAIKSRHIISPRATLEGLKLIAGGIDPATVADLVIWKGINREERAKIEAQAI